MATNYRAKEIERTESDGSSDWILLNPRCAEFNVGYNVVVTGTVTSWTIEGTMDDPAGSTPRAFSVATGSASGAGSFTTPVLAVRVTTVGVTAGEGVLVQLLQAGY
ncbi:MAG: hypothetical protein NXI16_01260 [Alphaproteobacteria bacterium]|nr:hypothetical protein [Alphaproteobacteria bacterium]